MLSPLPSPSSLMPFIVLPLWLLLLLPLTGNARDLKVFKRGKIELFDETEVQWPNDYSQDFDAEMRQNPEFMDIYDEQLPALPQFELHKNGKNLGWTKLPFVTRNKPYWLTPAPPTRPNDDAQRTYSTPKLEPVLSERAKEKVKEEAVKKVSVPEVPMATTTTTTAPTTTSEKATTTTTEAETSSLRALAVPTDNGDSDKNPIISSSRPSPSPSSSTTAMETTGQQPQRQGNALERLRKKLLLLQQQQQQQPNNNNRHLPPPVLSFPVEVPLKSNTFSIQQPANASPQQQQFTESSSSLADQFQQSTNNNNRRLPPSSLASRHRVVTVTETPATTSRKAAATTQGNNNGFAWSRSWSIGPDGRMVVCTWDSATQPRGISREHGECVEERVVGNNGTTPAPVVRKPYKPTFFQSGTYRHTGPTFDCRVLDPTVDGQPSGTNDPTCPLNFPGIPSDGSCQCTYQVSNRDDNGCAMGFVYTCSKTKKALGGVEVPFAASRRQRQ